MDQNYTFMFYGFLAAWLVVILYVISIALRERKLRSELDRVKRMVDEPNRDRKGA
ncbi:MAG TPA: CcmD family protein [Bryobacteraceae bacterium]|nr:CcmD family protein [Bryobacteraceae bacterium]